MKAWSSGQFSAAGDGRNTANVRARIAIEPNFMNGWKVAVSKPLLQLGKGNIGCPPVLEMAFARTPNAIEKAPPQGSRNRKNARILPKPLNRVKHL
jgi:hypothetical protein